MTFHFAGYTIDVGRRELRLQEEVVHVEPQVFDVLVYLIENRDRVVTKNDLFAAVWQGRAVLLKNVGNFVFGGLWPALGAIALLIIVVEAVLTRAVSTIGRARSASARPTCSASETKPPAYRTPSSMSWSISRPEVMCIDCTGLLTGITNRSATRTIQIRRRRRRYQVMTSSCATGRG